MLYLYISLFLNTAPVIYFSQLNNFNAFALTHPADRSSLENSSHRGGGGGEKELPGAATITCCFQQPCQGHAVRWRSHVPAGSSNRIPLQCGERSRNPCADDIRFASDMILFWVWDMNEKRLLEFFSLSLFYFIFITFLFFERELRYLEQNIRVCELQKFSLRKYT